MSRRSEFKARKAKQFGPTDDAVPEVLLKISGELPEVMTLTSAQKEFAVDAWMVMQALGSLPQGTRSRLLLLMLEEQTVYYTGTGAHGRFWDRIRHKPTLTAEQLLDDAQRTLVILVEAAAEALDRPTSDSTARLRSAVQQSREWMKTRGDHC